MLRKVTLNNSIAHGGIFRSRGGGAREGVMCSGGVNIKRSLMGSTLGIERWQIAMRSRLGIPEQKGYRRVHVRLTMGNG